ncbi:MAG: hypothetical protein HZA22_10065 [Nitrospirae bacterium]|nr:hypothetical protein [Nitrospirota bacterium]
MRRNRRLSAILSLFMLLMVTACGGMDGYVLCITEDGRVAVEAASGACCDDSVFAAGTYTDPATRRASDEDDHHCDSCVDIPLSSPELVRTASDASAKLRDAGFAVSPFTAPLFVTSSSRQLYFLPPPAARATLASIRTVNLRI